MIVYLARDIPAFVMYCVNGESGSSLLIESTDSMIYIIIYIHVYYMNVPYSRKISQVQIFSKMPLILNFVVLFSRQPEL